MKKRNFNYVLLTVIILILIMFAVYYLVAGKNLGRRGDLVGDGICGKYVEEAMQDDCCVRVRAKDVTFECIGDWKYIGGIKECQFICGEAEPVCPEDEKVCDDGRVVLRNATKECKFDDC